jgi:hypothetical protein
MAVRTYIRVTYIAMSPYGIPIMTAHTQEDLKAGLDKYYGVGEDSKIKCVGWIPYDSKYPDDYEGYYKYECDEGNGNIETDIVKVYGVEFYPTTRYEVDIQKEALIELTNINLEDEN